MPKSQDNTSQVAVSYSVIWSTKAPRPAVIQEVWKKAKLALISKAAEQVQAWQQALCSSWPSENTGKGIKQGKKIKIKEILKKQYVPRLPLPSHFTAEHFPTYISHEVEVAARAKKGGLPRPAVMT